MDFPPYSISKSRRRARLVTIGICLGLWAALLTSEAAQAEPTQAEPTCHIRVPQVILTNVPFSAVVTMDRGPVPENSSLRIGTASYPIPAAASGTATVPGLSMESSGAATISLLAGEGELCEAPARVISGWLALAPPLTAIVTAVVLRSVLPALFLGLWAGAWLLQGLDLRGLFLGLLSAFEQHVSAALIDPEHAAVILFVMMIGGMIGILSANGGMLAVVEAIQKVAHTRRHGQLMTVVLGFTVFFDDYANTLLVGKTMRPLTDRLQVSRQKLAFLVDSTASPVACLALVSTWIGYEVSLVAANQPESLDLSAYSIFLSSLPYSFYPILTLLFVLTIAASGRDFGPMRKAEIKAQKSPAQRSPAQGEPADEAQAARAQAARAQEKRGPSKRDQARSGPERALDSIAALAALTAPEPEGDLPSAPPGKQRRMINFIAPILVLVVSLVAGLLSTGEGESLQAIIGSADPYKALMWASFLGALSAAGLTVAQRILTLEQTLDSWYAGMSNTLLAMIILVLAWALSAVTQELHAADFLVARFAGDLAPQLLPALTFLLAAFISFATGSCFGTMGIVMPIVMPLAWGVLAEQGMTGSGGLHPIYLSVIASVLAGAIWGDHSSPISDTTILSSMAASCDHLDHVRTQMPYAIAVGTVSLVVGILPVAFGLPVWIGLGASAAVVISLPFLFGKPVDL